MNTREQVIVDFLKRSNTPQSMKDIVLYMRSMGFSADSFYAYTQPLVKAGIVQEGEKYRKKVYMVNMELAKKEPGGKISTKSIDSLRIPDSLKRQLRKNCLFTINQLIEFQEEDLNKLPGVGKNKAIKIKDALKELGLTLKIVVREVREIPSRVLNQGIGQLDLPEKVVARLEKQKIFMVKQLLAKDEDELVSYRGITESSCKVIKEALSKRGLNLGVEYHYESASDENKGFQDESVSVLSLPESAIERLKSNGIYTLRQFTDITKEEILLFFRGNLPSKVKLIEAELQKKHLDFKNSAMHINDDEEYLSVSVERLGIPFFICRTLEKANISTVGELLKCGNTELCNTLGRSNEKFLAVKEGIKRTKRLPLRIRNPEQFKAAQRMLNKPIARLDLSVRSTNVLEEFNISTIGELVRKNPQELLSINNCGHKSLKEIDSALKGYDLYVGMSIGEEIEASDEYVPVHFSEVFPLFNKHVDGSSKEKYSSLGILIASSGLDFSARALNVFNDLNVYTLLDLLFVTREDLARVKNVGKKTINEIFEKMHSYLEGNSLVNSIINEGKGKEGSQDETRVLPFFAGTIYKLEANDIKKIKPHMMLLSTLGLSQEVVDKFKDQGIVTLKQLVTVNFDELLLEIDLSRETLDGVRNDLLHTIQSLLHESEKLCVSLEDCLSYLHDQFDIKDGEALNVASREMKIFKYRIGYYEAPQTLLEISKKVGLTRERVRQLEAKSIEKIQSRLKLSYKIFLKKFCEEIEENGGVVLCKLNIENTLGDIKIFNLFLNKVSPSIKYDYNVNAWLGEGYDEEELRKFLDDSTQPGKAYVDEDLIRIAKRYNKLTKSGKKKVEAITVILKELFFEAKDGKYFFGDRHAGVMLEALIRDHYHRGIAIYKETDKLIQTAKDQGYGSIEKFSMRYMQMALSRTNNIVLWDWGVYIHTDNISVNYQILEEVLKWLHKALKRKDIVRVSIWGAFRDMEKECKKSGIPNEHALYSCMRMKYGDKFSFLKDPYVYAKGTEKTILAEDDFVKFVKKAGKAVSIKAIAKRFHLKTYQASSFMKHSENIYPWGRDQCIHVNNLKINNKDIENLYKEIVKVVKEYKYISIKQLYQDNIVLCSRNKIPNPHALYSLIKDKHTKGLFFPRYPHVLTKKHGIEDDGVFSFNDIAEDFFLSNNRIIPKHEIERYFIKKTWIWQIGGRNYKVSVQECY